MPKETILLWFAAMVALTTQLPVSWATTQCYIGHTHPRRLINKLVEGLLDTLISIVTCSSIHSEKFTPLILMWITTRLQLSYSQILSMTVHPTLKHQMCTLPLIMRWYRMIGGKIYWIVMMINWYGIQSIGNVISRNPNMRYHRIAISKSIWKQFWTRKMACSWTKMNTYLMYISPC